MSYDCTVSPDGHSPTYPQDVFGWRAARHEPPATSNTRRCPCDYRLSFTHAPEITRPIRTIQGIRRIRGIR
ncbi:hypothetical protein [Streptomyces aureocirculatus]|uniref:hypothetical protein n=1 Tax=Streptomyces aureocirculatus TaxID=67275 RepID=UPI0004CBC899|nr:hypothetical protein [Streptomyces aureocirculatus]